MPTQEMLKTSSFEQDNHGLWPMYIYNGGLGCGDV